MITELIMTSSSNLIMLHQSKSEVRTKYMWQKDTEMPINLFEIALLMILALMPLPPPSSTAASTAASGHQDFECLELKDLL